ncbi:MAG: N-acetyltransferase [Bacteroidaceae bacterium]
MSVDIRKVTTKKELKKFIRFNYEFYKTNPYSVPDLYDDMVSTFSPEKNAAYDFCEAAFFLAYQDGKIVGRVAAIINKNVNQTWNRKEVRFGWIDFIDDLEVSRSLIKSVEAWGKERGMEMIQGPLGFTDFDAEGMLVEGFDQLSTMATIYNYPYYPEHMEKLGFGKAVDWIELKLYVPEQIPDKFQRISDIVKMKFKLHIRKLKSRQEIKDEKLGQRIFELINESYAPLFGYTKMSQKQIEQYVKTYLQFIDLRMVTLVENEKNELVAVGISMPSLSTALQKAKGKLFPFGWYHLAKVLFLKKYPKMLDLLLIAVKPEYQNKGVNSLLFTDLIPIAHNIGYEYSESNPELELNEKVQSQWQYLKTEQHKRRRCFTKQIGV